MSNKRNNTTKETKIESKPRRDFMVMSASAAAAIGGACTIKPMVTSLQPADDVLALANTKVNISEVQPGQSKKIMWRGKPVFIKRRTEDEIKEAKEQKLAELPDPQDDADRVVKGKEEWLVLVGICTHLGCVPIADKGDYEGFFCPCHGSHYDTSGRIRKGPAPTNLEVPPYYFENETTIVVGTNGDNKGA